MVNMHLFIIKFIYSGFVKIIFDFASFASFASLIKLLFLILVSAESISETLPMPNKSSVETTLRETYLSYLFHHIWVTHRW